MDTAQLLTDFLKVSALAGKSLNDEDIVVQHTKSPHVPPTKLPPGKMAVYVFSHNQTVLKVGKAGPKSNARFCSQHYRAGSAPSTLAASLLKDAHSAAAHSLTIENAGIWIRQNTDRINFLLRVECGIAVLSLLESFLQCRLKPKFEGFASQQ